MSGDQPPQNLISVPAPATHLSLAEDYSTESGRIRQQFDRDGAGRRVLKDRADLVDSVVLKLYRETISPTPQGPPGLCLLALGGYGRRELFPQSDIDLLFLTGDGSAPTAQRENIAALLRMLWDMRMRVGHSTRT